jgi:putative phosphoesterase
MRLAVISDTHLPGPDYRFEAVYQRYLEDADVLLHCGDMTGAELYYYLARHKNFLCVRGNCDYMLADLPATLSRELALPGGGTLRVGMAHGWGERGGVWRRVAETFPGHGLVCYGHTHRRDWNLRGDAQVLNPGSVAEGSLAIVDVADGGGMDCHFIDLP